MSIIFKSAKVKSKRFIPTESFCKVYRKLKEDSLNSLKKDLSTLSIPEGYLNYYNNLNDIFSLYSSYLNSIRTAIIYERSSSGYEKNKNVIDKNYDTAYEKYNNVLDNIHQFLSLLENS